MRISAWSIRNPIPVVVLFIALLIAGFAGYRSLQIKLFPDVSFPLVQVTITLPGASAREVETQITRLVEAAVFDVAGATGTATDNLWYVCDIVVGDGGTILRIDSRQQFRPGTKDTPL